MHTFAAKDNIWFEPTTTALCTRVTCSKRTVEIQFQFNSKVLLLRKAIRENYPDIRVRMSATKADDGKSCCSCCARLATTFIPTDVHMHTCT